MIMVSLTIHDTKIGRIRGIQKFTINRHRGMNEQHNYYDRFPHEIDPIKLIQQWNFENAIFSCRELQLGLETLFQHRFDESFDSTPIRRLKFCRWVCPSDDNWLDFGAREREREKKKRISICSSLYAQVFLEIYWTLRVDMMSSSFSAKVQISRFFNFGVLSRCHILVWSRFDPSSGEVTARYLRVRDCAS